MIRQPQWMRLALLAHEAAVHPGPHVCPSENSQQPDELPRMKVPERLRGYVTKVGELQVKGKPKLACKLDNVFWTLVRREPEWKNSYSLEMGHSYRIGADWMIYVKYDDGDQD